MKDANGETFSIGNLFFMIILVFSIIAILIAFLGCATAKWSNKCTICCNATFTFIVAAAYILIGVLLVAINGATQTVIDEYCAKFNAGVASSGVGTTFNKFFDGDLSTMCEDRSYSYKNSCLCPTDVRSSYGSVDKTITYSSRASSKTVNTYIECWEYLNDKSYSQDVKDAVKKLEEEFECSGLCSIPDFYYSLDVTKVDPPNLTCL